MKKAPREKQRRRWGVRVKMCGWHWEERRDMTEVGTVGGEIERKGALVGLVGSARRWRGGTWSIAAMAPF